MVGIVVILIVLGIAWSVKQESIRTRQRLNRMIDNSMREHGFVLTGIQSDGTRIYTSVKPSPDGLECGAAYLPD